MYAGYRQPDGSVIGDPMHVDFTEVISFVTEIFTMLLRLEPSKEIILKSKSV